MEKTIALIPGDGIGPDIIREGVRVLDGVCNLSFNLIIIKLNHTQDNSR